MYAVQEHPLVVYSGFPAYLRPDFPGECRRHLHQVVGNDADLLLSVGNDEGMGAERGMRPVRQTFAGSKSGKLRVFLFGHGNVSGRIVAIQRTFIPCGSCTGTSGRHGHCRKSGRQHVCDKPFHQYPGFWTRVPFAFAISLAGIGIR